MKKRTAGIFALAGLSAIFSGCSLYPTYSYIMPEYEHPVSMRTAGAEMSAADECVETVAKEKYGAEMKRRNAREHRLSREQFQELKDICTKNSGELEKFDRAVTGVIHQRAYSRVGSFLKMLFSPRL